MTFRDALGGSESNKSITPGAVLTRRANQRALTAVWADALRSSGVIFSALALPPLGTGPFTHAGERELTTGLLAKEASFRLIVSGKVGVRKLSA